MPFKDDKPKDAENTGFQAGSDNTPLAIPFCSVQTSPLDVPLYAFGLPPCALLGLGLNILHLFFLFLKVPHFESVKSLDRKKIKNPLDTLTCLMLQYKKQNKKRELVLQAERKVRPSTENLIWIMPT